MSDRGRLSNRQRSTMSSCVKHGNGKFGVSMSSKQTNQFFMACGFRRHKHFAICVMLLKRSEIILKSSRTVHLPSYTKIGSKLVWCYIRVVNTYSLVKFAATSVSFDNNRVMITNTGHIHMCDKFFIS